MASASRRPRGSDTTLERRATIAILIAEGEKALAESGIGPARMEAEVLLAKILGVARSALILEPGAAVAEAAAAVYRADVATRATRYPLQYITGIQEFHSLDFEVDARVLIPRPETEMIVDEALRIAGGAGAEELVGTGASVGGRVEAVVRARQRATAAPLIIDVGTGSGCLAVTLAVRLPRCRVFASDISEGALEVAVRNAARHGVADRIRFARGDGLEPVLEAGLAGQADVIVSNPPYVPEAELEGLQPELSHEPRGALTPGPDGLSFTTRLIEDAAVVLRPGGHLLVELGARSDERARRLLDPGIWRDIGVDADHQGIPRLLRACRRSGLLTP
jgi:release factor glutamine methyltransferase